MSVQVCFSADGCVLSLGSSGSVVCAWPVCGKAGKNLVGGCGVVVVCVC